MRRARFAQQHAFGRAAFHGPWQRTAVGIALVAFVAMASTAIAVFSAAQKADTLAREHEKQLVGHALTDYQDQRAAHVASAARAYPFASGLAHPAAFADLLGHTDDQADFAVAGLVDLGRGEFRTVAGADYLLGDKENALSELRLLLAGLDQRRSYPDKAGAGVERGLTSWQMLGGRPAIIAAARTYDGAVPQKTAVISVTFVVEGFLRQIGRRLGLPDLRVMRGHTPRSGDVALPVADSNGKHLVTLVWSAQHPSAEIIGSVLPFVGIALGGLLFAAGVILMYIRHTRAAIAEGEDRLRHLAMHDPLSGLPNRTVFGQRLEESITAARQGTPTAVLSIDLDHFKDVNDTLGHHIGDSLIAAVAGRLARVLRDRDLVARLGGDEFAVITCDVVEPAPLHELSRRIIEQLSTPYYIAGHTILIGASVGIVVLDAAAPSAPDVMRFADMALYRAKSEGRNRTCLYDAAMNAELTQRKQLEADLRVAIQKSGLSLAFQPVVSPDGERMIGVEALCRWNHPTRGAISPAEFIPVAERSGLIIQLGEWVLRRACREARDWPGLIISVNVSPLQFRRPDFVETIERILRTSNLEPNRLELELTESTLLGNVEGAEAAMQRLKTLGVRLALDDFGTGYSSLLYLRKFPFDKLKIDHSFVGSLETAPDAAAIVHAVVSLGRGLGMKVTAEGVETAEQQLFLRAAGVHFLQGYRFGRPMEASAIAARLARQTGDRPPLRQLSIVN